METKIQNTPDITSRLLKLSGICSRGTDSFVYGEGGVVHDRMGIMQPDGSLILWVPSSPKKVSKFLDLLDYCDRNKIVYHYGAKEFKDLVEDVQTLSSLLVRLNERL